MGVDEATRQVNTKTISRLMNPGKWAKSTKTFTSGDIDKVCNHKDTSVKRVTARQARKLGMRFSVCGFLEEIGREAIDEEAIDLDSEEDKEKSESEDGREVSPCLAGQNLEGSEVDQGVTRNLR
jgi:hypothetical protein